MKVGINKNRKGLVILAVLWTIVVLMVIVAVLGRKSRLDMKVCMARMDAVRCKWAGRAGVEGDNNWWTHAKYTAGFGAGLLPAPGQPLHRQ